MAVKPENTTALAELEQVLRTVISEARPHVYRQQYHGRHEQDREDATAWIEKWIKPDGGV